MQLPALVDVAPWKRRLLAPSLAQFSMVLAAQARVLPRVVLLWYHVWDRSLHQKDPSWPARESRRLAQACPGVADRSLGLRTQPTALLLDLCCWPGRGCQGCAPRDCALCGRSDSYWHLLDAPLWAPGARTGSLDLGWEGREGLGRPDRGHHGSGPLWAFVRFCDPWRLAGCRRGCAQREGSQELPKRALAAS